MNPIINQYIDSLNLGSIQVFKNMAIVPLFLKNDTGPDYLTLQEALDKKVLKITELSESGSVPELKVENTGTEYVLLLDGEELMGAKQNRVLNTTILLKPDSQTVIPVSCTEQGRWSYSSEEFSSSGHIMEHGIRSSKMKSVHASLRHGSSYRSDQGEVWNEIHNLSAKAKVASSTGAMRDVYESKSTTLAEYEKAFDYQPAQQGFLVMINGEVVGFDILSRSAAFQKLYSKLIKSYAMDAMLQKSSENVSFSMAKAQAFINAVTDCSVQTYPSVGEGEDYRFEGKMMVGSGLVVEEAVIHIAFFRVTEADNKTNDNIASYRQRRAFRSSRRESDLSLDDDDDDLSLDDLADDDSKLTDSGRSEK
ncbi:conserved hypothetical protein [Beggiatoa sp. PS]|nr:conserved hypothetical protein [Beggiatoa sp. PS]